MKKKNYSKKNLVFVIAVGIIFILLIIFLAIGQFSNLFKKEDVLANVIIGLAIIFSVGFAIVLSYYINHLSLVKTLQMEN